MEKLYRLILLSVYTLIFNFLPFTIYGQLFQNELIVGSGISAPVSMAFLPDGRMLILELTGGIKIGTDPREGIVEVNDYMSLSDISIDAERGLLDIALDPDFENNGFFYLYYPKASENKYLIARFVHNENQGGITSSANIASEVVLWMNKEEIVNAGHYGGGLVIGPDEKIYLSIGEEFAPLNSQDLASARGKVLRFNLDGSIPEDNPFYNGPGSMGPNGELPEIYAWGLRNPFRAVWDFETNRLFVADVGDTDRSTSYEEINVVHKSGNYGWPVCQGPCNNELYVDPVYTYAHSSGIGGEASVTGGFMYRGNQFPEEYRGGYFFGDYSRGGIWYVTFDESQEGVPVIDVSEFPQSQETKGIVFLNEGPDGALYYLNIISGQVRRIAWKGTLAPVIKVIEAVPDQGNAPLTVAFFAEVEDDANPSLIYTWNFGDNITKIGQNVGHTFDVNGRYTVHLEISDGENQTISEPLIISVGTPPQVVIQSPQNGSFFKAGETILLKAGVNEEIDDENIEWTLYFAHDSHIHPRSTVKGRNNSFEISDSGHSFYGNTGYKVILTVKDEDGLISTSSVEIIPEKINLTLESQPSGIAIKLDDIPRIPPFVLDEVKNFKSGIKVDSIALSNGILYDFIRWSHGRSRNHILTIPENDLSIIANFVQCPSIPNDQNLALNKNVFVSSVQEREDSRYSPDKATDGDLNTWWSSNWSKIGGLEWMYIDLENIYLLDKVVIQWREDFYPKDYNITVSVDGLIWITVATITDSNGGVDEVELNPAAGRYIRMNGINRLDRVIYQIYEFDVFGSAIGGTSNTAPYIKDPKGNVWVDANSNGLNWNMLDIFDDKEDGAGGLQFEIFNNTNEGLVNAEINNSNQLNLNFTPDNTGQATISLKATDSKGLFVEKQFTVFIGERITPPTNLAAQPLSISSIQITWEDNADNEDYYVIESSLTEGSAFTVLAFAGANTTSHKHVGLEEGQTVYYKVKAVNNNGESEYSNITSATTSGNTVVTDIGTRINDDSLLIYPNPVTDLVYVNLKNNYQGQLNFRILGLQGKVLKEFIDNKISLEYSTEINTSTFQQGLYIIQIIGGNIRETKLIQKL